MVSSGATAGPPVRRVIVLGASNVTRGLRIVCQSAACLWGQPLDVLAAIGHGRSYGMSSCVFGRTLPGIRSCELWEEWRAREALPSAALITDIGNDLVYGATPRQIGKWVRDCGERLVERCERVVVTGLPLGSLMSVGPQRFKILSAILFPSSRLTREQVIDSASELNERVTEIASDLHLEWSSPDPSWFGIDPIHIRRRHWVAAWNRILHPLRDAKEESTVPSQVPAPWKLRGLRPRHRWLFGIEQRQPQPVWNGTDGSRLSLY